MAKDKRSDAGGGNPPGDNPGNQGSPANQTATLEQLQEQVKKLQGQVEEQNRTITELSQSKATYEQRLSEIDNRPPEPQLTQPALDIKKRVAEAVEEAQVDPAGAIQKLGNLLEEATTNAQGNAIRQAMGYVENFLSFNSYVEKVRNENKDLQPYEPMITARARQLMEERNPKTGKPYDFKSAVDTAVSEFKNIRDKDIANIQKGSPSTPPGANGEEGKNQPPSPPPPEKEETLQDYLANRETQSRSKVL